jgi:hypothetical protein
MNVLKMGLIMQPTEISFNTLLSRKQFGKTERK